ncbi:MAG: anti-sigma factor family protein [Polyangia bacterium]
MAADCEQTRARMLELIYGELPPAARAEVDAHVAGCAACRAELAALQSTRALARRSLAADEPPARARAAILRAATAALPAAPRPAAPASKPSAWAWLRGKWTLPTFATVGAVAVFLLASRIFLEPEKTYQRGREGLVPPEPAAQPVVPKAEPAEPAGAGPAGFAPEPSFAVKPAAAPARRRHAAPAARADQPQSEGEQAAPQFAPPPPAAPAPPAAAGGDLLERRFDQDRTPAFGMTEDRQGSAGAATPPAAASSAKAHAAPRAMKKAEAPAVEQFEAPAAAASTAPRAAGGRESPVARADRLFTQARWAEAAIAYRELLRDDPRNPEVPRWRQRLAACEAAARSPSE